MTLIYAKIYTYVGATVPGRPYIWCCIDYIDITPDWISRAGWHPPLHKYITGWH